jgi:hypothetical protein
MAFAMVLHPIRYEKEFLSAISYPPWRTIVFCSGGCGKKDWQ